MFQAHLQRTFRKAILLAGVAAFSLSLAHTAQADCASASCDDVRILTLYTAPDTNVYVKVSGATGNLACTLYAGIYVRVPPAANELR